MSELLWSPQDESISSSNLYKFYSYIEEKYNTSFNSNYELLWKWSIQHKNDFWPSLIEFLKIDFFGDINPTLSSHKFIYDHEFFPNIKINYAANILNKMNENPIIFINEKNFRVEVTKNELFTKSNEAVGLF
jgi:acetoacetyl-CoA synthetase